MTTKQPDFADVNALAIEACDMWQEHLSTFASDPDARAELTRFLEPQRRLFADWAALVQKGAAESPAAGEAARNESMQKEATHESGHQTPSAQPAAQPTPQPAAPPAPPQPIVQPEPVAPAPPCAASGSAANGDDPLRTAQLALRVAELEKRLGQLERQFARNDKSSAGASRRAQRETP